MLDNGPPIHSLPRLKKVLAALPALLLAACMVKEKPEKPLGSGALTPPWSPVRFEPKRLEGYAFAGPESLFAVFEHIARLDSLSGDPRAWQVDAESGTGPTIGQLLDTGFVFPEHAEAVMPYGYDDSFRDDTLFRHAYGNGLFAQDQPCAETYVLSGNFLHPARWLRAGMGREYILGILGNPAYNHPGVLRYLSRRNAAAPTREEEEAPDRDEADAEDAMAGPPEEPEDVFEGVNFYFEGDSLFAAVLQKSRPCH